MALDQPEPRIFTWGIIKQVSSYILHLRPSPHTIINQWFSILILLQVTQWSAGMNNFNFFHNTSQSPKLITRDITLVIPRGYIFFRKPKKRKPAFLVHFLLVEHHGYAKDMVSIHTRLYQTYITWKVLM